MGDIADLLSLKEIKVIEDSNFESSHGSDVENTAEILNRTGDIKEILLARARNKVPTEVDGLIESSYPASSHLRIYGLGCGLQIILPIDRAKGTVTASSEVILNKALCDYIEFRNRIIHDSPGYKAVPFLGATRYSRKGLIKLLKDKSFMPLVIKEAKPRNLGEYYARFSVNKGITGLYADRKVEFADSSLIFSYIANMNTGKNPDKIQNFEIKYKLKGPKKEIEVTIDAKYNQGGSYKTCAFIKKEVLNGYEAKFKFENERLSRSCIELSEQNKELVLDREFLQRLSSGMEAKQPSRFQDLAALHILDMPSLTSRLDYVSAITNIIKIALMPTDEIKANFQCYIEGLEQLKSLSYK